MIPRRDIVFSMFIGHYAVALAAKRFAPAVSLGSAFFAVQFLDVLWAPAILLGIERARVIPGFLPASSLDLYYMPWTHSLFMAVAWSWLFYRVTKSAVLGACVFSHWVLDFVAHGPDLPILLHGPLVGLGLWRFRDLSFVVESGLLLAGLAIYMSVGRARTGWRFAMGGFAATLIAIEAFNLYGPPLTNIKAVAIGGEASYLMFAGIAHWLDRFRDSGAV